MFCGICQVCFCIVKRYGVLIDVMGAQCFFAKINFRKRVNDLSRIDQILFYRRSVFSCIRIIHHYAFTEIGKINPGIFQNNIMFGVTAVQHYLGRRRPNGIFHHIRWNFYNFCVAVDNSASLFKTIQSIFIFYKNTCFIQNFKGSIVNLIQLVIC